MRRFGRHPAPLKRQDLIALDMLELTLPAADEASARLRDVVVFMRCVPLLIMIRNVALAMVTEVFTPVEGERR
jgi:hypothetical protein